MTALTSSSLSSSSASSLPLSHVSELEADDLLERITHIKDQIKHQQELLTTYLDALDQLVEDGTIDSDLTWNDWHIYRQPGKTSYTFPEHIREQEADLKQSKELAIAFGDAVAKVGKPFWTIRAST